MVGKKDLKIIEDKKDLERLSKGKFVLIVINGFVTSSGTPYIGRGEFLGRVGEKFWVKREKRDNSFTRMEYGFDEKGKVIIKGESSYNLTGNLLEDDRGSLVNFRKYFE